MNTNEPKKSEAALREEAIQTFWEQHDIFNKSLTSPAGEAPIGEFVFYDGPPFATGLPHYGHLLAGTIKDTVPRFWTMNGYQVRRKWGWDCHGLPLENLIEKKLGLATKRDIETYGVKNFNEAARAAVMEYADDWRRIIPRMGRFVDMDDDYKTMDSSYTESVWWVFSELNKKGLVFEGFKTMHLCPRCGTTLSNFEVNLGYKDIKDIAVTVKLPLLDETGAVTDTSLLVWTTTPWTLPGNLAAAVHNEHDYVNVKVMTDEGSEFVVLAKARLAQIGTDAYEIMSEMKGSDLVGKKYQPPFPYLHDQIMEGKESAWQILHADYVEVGEEGTGAVHLAPAYGEDDMLLAKEYGIPIFHHVDNAGHFMNFVTDFAGQLVKPKDNDDAGVTHLDADIEIVKALKARGKLFKKENITHSYPHCWRCDTPLLNYATTSWFVNVPKIKDQIVAENKQVHWVPEHVGRARFGKWLEGARDWAVSRQRYWGAPLPIWRHPETKEYKVFGSLAELVDHAPASTNTYYLMRHGESVKNTSKVVTDVFDAPYPLTEAGKQETKQTAALLRGSVDLIITSPVLRAKETAELMAAELGIDTEMVIVDERIRETEHGIYEGRLIEDFFTEFPRGLSRFDNAPEGGETWSDIKSRMGEFLYSLEHDYTGKRILIISHGDPLALLNTVCSGCSKEETVATWDELYPKKGIAVKTTFTPLPHNDNYELDFHRPYIDDYVVVDEDGTKLERVSDVFDCWFESGSMPYAEMHYPFENTDHFNPVVGKRFPANFIAESIDQTRGWFYSMMVLGVALFGKSPYQNVITNGLVLAEDGRKMSKSLQNYPDPVELADRQGVDAMRFYLLSSSIIKGEDLNFSEKEVMELQRKNIGRLHNVLAMYEEYAGEEESRNDSDHVLDRWIISRLNQLITETTAGFKNYELDKATRPITDFIDDLSVWYLRRSRERIKGVRLSGDQSQEIMSSADVKQSSDTRDSSSEEVDIDKAAALSTLRYTLQHLALVMAPSMPFYAEYLWQAVKADEAAESVHLAAWPASGEVDEELITGMRVTRDIVTVALEQRAKAKIKVRQPLPSLMIMSVPEDMWPLITDEVNVKTLTIGTEVMLDTTITSELQAEGDAREFMRQVQELRKRSGLSPSDRITLTIQTSHNGKALVTQFQTDIQKTVGAVNIQFGDTIGTEVTAGVHEFTVAIEKV